MKLLRCALICLLGFSLCQAQPFQQAKKRRLLAIGAVKGFQHDATSYGLATIWKLGQESGLFETYIRTDTELITKQPLKSNAKNLGTFDAVLFYTTGELDMTDQQKADLLSFVREDGKGFIGVHSANDTFYKWPEYGEMVGGYFDGHPWNTMEMPILVEDRTFPATRHLPEMFVIKDEIYQARNFSRDNVRVLMRLDTSKLDMTRKGIKRTDNDFAVTWARTYGKGRVFYSSFGHTEEAWDHPGIQRMWLEAIRWAMGLVPGDAKPRPMPAK